MMAEPDDDQDTTAEPLLVDGADSDYVEFSQHDEDSITFRDDHEDDE